MVDVNVKLSKSEAEAAPLAPAAVSAGCSVKKKARSGSRNLGISGYVLPNPLLRTWRQKLSRQEGDLVCILIVVGTPRQLPRNSIYYLHTYESYVIKQSFEVSRTSEGRRHTMWPVKHYDKGSSKPGSPQRKRRLMSAVAAIGTAMMAAVSSPVSAFSLSGTAWEAAAAEEGIDPYLLFSVALVESAKHENRFARPWPWALNGPKGNFYGDDRREAERHLRSMPSADLQRTAVGMMQVYVGAHGKRVADPADLLDPALNLRMGATILRESIASKPGDLALGIGRYNAWQNEPAARAYGQRVLAVYQRLKQLTGSGLSVSSLWND